MRCAGCELPGQGYAHTCAGSGTYVAAEAHVAEQVEQISADWPRFDVHMNFQIRSLDERMVRDKLIPLVSALLEDDLVEHSDFVVKLAEQASA